MEAGDYDGAIAAFEAAYYRSEKHTESLSRAKDATYDKAVALLERKDYDGAIKVFNALDGYKDSTKQLKTISLINPEIGKTVYFGNYVWNTSLDNYPIAWRVLEVEDHRILVISEYVLVYQRYDNEIGSDGSWQASFIREWLNNGFLNNAFSEEERKCLTATTVPYEHDLALNSNSENENQDIVYLLSEAELEKYFKSEDDRKCKATGYALAHSPYEKRQTILSNKGDYATWWVRSEGGSQTIFSFVNPDGYIISDAKTSSFNSLGIRPAVWINTEHLN